MTSATHVSWCSKRGAVTTGSRLMGENFQAFFQQKTCRLSVLKKGTEQTYNLGFSPETEFLDTNQQESFLPSDVGLDGLFDELKVLVHPPNGLEHACIVWTIKRWTNNIFLSQNSLSENSFMLGMCFWIYLTRLLVLVDIFWWKCKWKVSSEILKCWIIIFPNDWLGWYLSNEKLNGLTQTSILLHNPFHDLIVCVAPFSITQMHLLHNFSEKRQL